MKKFDAQWTREKAGGHSYHYQSKWEEPEGKLGAKSSSLRSRVTQGPAPQGKCTDREGGKRLHRRRPIGSSGKTGKRKTLPSQAPKRTMTHVARERVATKLGGMQE